MQIVHINEEQLCGTTVLNHIRACIEATGRCAVLVPQAIYRDRVRRSCADARIPVVGLEVLTLEDWCTGLWALYGDERRLLSDLHRGLSIRNKLNHRYGKDFDGSALPQLLNTLPATAELLTRLGKEHLLALSKLEASSELLCLSPAEEAVCQLVIDVDKELSSQGYLDPQRILSALDISFAKQAKGQSFENFLAQTPLVLLAMTELKGSFESLCYYLAASSLKNLKLDDSGLDFCTLFARSGSTYISEQRLAASVASRFGFKQPDQADGEVIDLIEPGHPEGLLNLIRHLQTEEIVYAPSGDIVKEQMKEFSQPQELALYAEIGAFAEQDTLVHELKRLLDELGSDQKAIVALPRLDAQWQQLAYRLSAEGLKWQTRACPLGTGNVVMSLWCNFARTVAYLLELRSQEESLEKSSESSVFVKSDSADQMAYLEPARADRLRDTSWWPPRDIIDFLLSDISSASKKDVWELDKSWRQNRSLRPARVIEDLKKSRTSSRLVSAMVSELEQGKLVSAIHLMLKNLQQALAAEELPKDRRFYLELVQAELTHLYKAASELEEIRPDVSSAVLKANTSLVEKIDQLLESVEQKVFRVRIGSSFGVHTVELVSYEDLLQLEPLSVDLMWLSGLDLDQSPLPSVANAYQTFCSHLGLQTRLAPRRALREKLLRALLAIRAKLCLSHSIYGLESSEVRPSPLWEDLTSVIANPEVQSLCQDERETVTLKSSDAMRLEFEQYQLATISEDHKPYVLLPHPSLGERLLSASQIDTYLDCPYKWFLSRRLNLDLPDTDFSGKEKGTFAHKVLETFYSLQHERDLVKDDLSGEVNLDSAGVAIQPEASLDFDEVFADCLAHQSKEGGLSLIAHTEEDLVGIQKIHDDLKHFVDIHSKIFKGFKPCYFELNFGTDPVVSYAGQFFQGKIDRIDVDEQGNAIIIDYKYKKYSKDIVHEYGLGTLPDKDDEHFAPQDYQKPEDSECEWAMPSPPHRLQSFIYGEAAAQLLPELNIVGIFYAGMNSNPAASAWLQGFVQEGFEELVENSSIPGFKVDITSVKDLSSFMKDIEASAEPVIKALFSGAIPIAPSWSKACNFCPHKTCPQRWGE